MTVNENIKKCIQSKGYNLKEFAQLANITYMGLIKNLSPNNRMRIDTLLEYSKLLGVSVSELIGDIAPTCNCGDIICPNCGARLDIKISARTE